MAFPVTPLDVKIELSLNSVWTDVTSYVFDRDESAIQITRGRQDEGTTMEPSSCSLTFNNRDGRFSPRNPTSPYYGVLGRNTPIRVSARLGGRRLATDSSTAVSVTAPDSAALSVVGDLDIRSDASLLSWWGTQTLVSKLADPLQRSYALSLNGGFLFLYWSADGANYLNAASTIQLPQTTGRQAVRATIDVDNGAAGRTITFYTAPTSAGPWAQLGAAVVQAGVTSIFNSTSGAQVNIRAGNQIYSAEIRNGIGGALVGNPIFTAQAEGATSFSDGLGNTWTVPIAASVTDRRYRFHGEVSSWPARWDASGKDVWTPVSAAGVTRRIGQGSSPLLGAVQRAVLRTTPAAVAYWPCEDEDGSTSIASGLPSGSPMTITGTPTLATSTAFPSSQPLPEMTNALFSGGPAAHTPSGTVQARFLLNVPATGDADGAILLRLFTTGTAARWDLRYDTAGSGGLTLLAYDAFGANILSSGAGFQVNGKKLIVLVELVQNGANIDWKILTVGVLANDGLQFTATLAGRTVGGVSYLQISPNQLLNPTAIGHVMLHNGLASDAVRDGLRGYLGEVAGRRVERLCTEEGVAFSGRGDLDDSAPMGVQLPGLLLDLLNEAQTADLGAVLEPRESLGLGYRARTSVYSQPVGLALAYGNLQSLEPVDDDQATRNDVTVSRVGGSSARQEQTTGPLSTQAPPNGVGRYEESVAISVATDAVLPDQASWRLHLGTTDETRYPLISVALETPSFSASSALTTSALDLDIGDLLTISNPPAWLPPDQIRQLAQGFTETLTQFAFAIEVNCSPASGWDVGVYDDTNARYSADGATLSAGITSTATGAAALSIVTPAGKPLWTSAPADFPLDIVVGGERITLSAIAATASPQAATVSARSVNGVVKAHLAGAALDVADPDYYAL